MTLDLNREQILDHPFGYEMDMLLAEHIFGWKNLHLEFIRGVDCPGMHMAVGDDPNNHVNEVVPAYSTDANEALVVLEKLRARWPTAYATVVTLIDEGRWSVHLHYPDRTFSVDADSLPLATGRAALLLVLEMQ